MINKEINIDDLKSLLLKSIQNKKQRKPYHHQLLPHCSYIEAFIKEGGLHTDLAIYFNRLYETDIYTNNKIKYLREYWKKINIINAQEVEKIRSSFKTYKLNDSNKNKSEILDYGHFSKEVYKLTKDLSSIKNELNFFWSANKEFVINSVLTYEELALKFVNELKK